MTGGFGSGSGSGKVDGDSLVGVLCFQGRKWLKGKYNFLPSSGFRIFCFLLVLGRQKMKVLVSSFIRFRGGRCLESLTENKNNKSCFFNTT